MTGIEAVQAMFQGKKIKLGGDCDPMVLHFDGENFILNDHGQEFVRTLNPGFFTRSDFEICEEEQPVEDPHPELTAISARTWSKFFSDLSKKEGILFKLLEEQTFPDAVKTYLADLDDIQKQIEMAKNASSRVSVSKVHQEFDSLNKTIYDLEKRLKRLEDTLF